jgi:hypothetical protein
MKSSEQIVNLDPVKSSLNSIAGKSKLEPIISFFLAVYSRHNMSPMKDVFLGFWLMKVPVYCRGTCSLHMVQAWTKIWALLTLSTVHTCNSSNSLSWLHYWPAILLLSPSLWICISRVTSKWEKLLPLRAPKALESLVSMAVCWLTAICLQCHICT